MKKDLKIIIAGKSATGKSSMMFLLEKLLKENGFNVVLDMTLESLDYPSETKFREVFAENLTEKEEKLLKENTKITLSTKQVIHDIKTNKEEIKTDNND